MPCGPARKRPSFLTSLSAAIRMGTRGPEILQRFLLERELWKQLGLTREGIASRPHKEIRDLELIISMIQREEAAQAKRHR